MIGLRLSSAVSYRCPISPLIQTTNPDHESLTDHEPQKRNLMNLPNAQTQIEVSAKDLPLHCPTPDTSLWNSHPRVFIPIEESGEAKCPYCGTVFVMKKEQTDNASQ